MRIVYLIVAYHLPEQLIRLVKRLNNKDCYFIIHFDRKAKKEDFKKIQEDLKDYSNVFFTEKRYKCYWGGFGIVKATIQMINELIEKNIQFDHGVLLSGQTYPIKSNKYIKEFLEKNKERSFIMGLLMPTSIWTNGGMDRIEKWHIKIKNKHYIFPKENLPIIIKRRFLREFQPYGGSTWWVLNRELLIYINEFIKNNHKFVNFFKYVNIPDEIFFHTIILNSPLKEKIIINNLLFEIWLSNPTKPGSPEILTKKNFEQLKNSDKLFARKFDINIDSEILDMVDKELLN